MNELSGRYVNVVLSVEEGRGMDFLKNHVQIVANFNGRILESDFIEPEECPLFNTELVWETEKKDLRKIRSANTPLRVDVHTFDAAKRKIKIGHLLLNPRSAGIITKQSTAEAPFKWHKLLGVPPDFKSSHPELFISLTIRDHVPEVQEQAGSVSGQVIEEENESSGNDSSEKIVPVFPVKYFEDGFIQVGEDSKISRSFYLSINIKSASNLDLLLPEILVFTNNKEKYYLSFSMFGIVIKTKPFWRELHESLTLNEKVVVSLISSHEILRAFFHEHCEVFVRFYCGRDKLGVTKINIQNLFTGQEEQKVYTVNEQCRFKYPSPHGIVPVGVKGRKPSIEVETILESKDLPSHFKQRTYEDSKELSKGDFDFASRDDIVQDDKVQFSSAQGSPRTPGIDDCAEEAEERRTETLSALVGAGEKCDVTEEQITCELLGSHKLGKKSVSTHEIAPVKSETFTSKSVEMFLEKIPELNFSIPRLENSVKEVSFQKYCLDITLDRITWKKPPKTTQFRIKFKHPRANTFYLVNANISNTLDEEIALEGVKCRMLYVSSPEDIRKTLYAWSAKVLLTDEEDKVLTEDLNVYTAAFLVKDRQECSYQTEMKAFKTYDPIAKVGVCLTLDEYGLATPNDALNCELQPAILDENVALKELEELQEWKKAEKIKFINELQVLQEKHIATLQEDWIKKKNELESKLTNKIVKIKALKEELQNAVNKLKVKKQIQIKEVERKNTTDIKSQIERYCTHDRKDLIQTVFELEQQNHALKELVEEQQDEIEQIKKTALTKEQTTTLLQELRGLEEKFEDAQKTKNYFKEEWKKAVREIHELRTEDHKQIQNQLQCHREELSQLSLENFFKSDADSSDKGIGDGFGSVSKRSSEFPQSMEAVKNFVGNTSDHIKDQNLFYHSLVTGYSFIHDA